MSCILEDVSIENLEADRGRGGSQAHASAKTTTA